MADGQNSNSMEVDDSRLVEAQLHGSFFDSLVSTIPAKIYMREAFPDQSSSSRYMHNKKGSAPKQSIKEQSKKGQRAAAARQSVLDLQAQAAQEEAEAVDSNDGSNDNNDNNDSEPAVKAQPKRAKRKASSRKADVAEDEEAPDNGSDDDNNDNNDNDASTAEGGALPNGPIFRATTHQELRERLKEKLHALKVKRKVDVETNKAKQARKTVANRRAKLKEERQRKSMVRQAKVDLQLSARGTDAAADGEPQAKKKKVVFSKFDFGDKERKKAKPTPQQMLQMAEKQEEKMKLLKQKDPTKATEMEEKTAWKKALQKASGEKVFDDAGLVKKRIKRIEKQKSKSTKAWKSRQAEVEQEQKGRQEKRQANLQKRIDGKKEKRLKKLRKKGRSVPGF